MFIRDCMTAGVVCTTEDATVRQAVDLLAAHDVRQLPVVRAGDRLVGIITDRDTRGVPVDRRGEPVSRVMTPSPVTVRPDELLEEALLLLHHHRFEALPVVAPPAGGAGDDALPRLVGIITRTDILGALIDLLGIEEPGTRLEIELPDTDISRICGATSAIARSGARVISMTLSSVLAGRPTLNVRLSTIDVRPVVAALSEAGFRVSNQLKALA